MTGLLDGGKLVYAIDFRTATARLGRETYLVSLTGELDMHVAPQLDEALERTIDDGASRVLVDLSAVGFIDSTGVAALLRAARRLRERGGELRLVCDDRRIIRTFELAGIDTALPIEHSLTEAIARPPGGPVAA
jgi:anti-sigma B factor antagonist